MRRCYLDALLEMNERTLFLAGMMEWVGFRQPPGEATRPPRTGPPSYSWLQRATLAFDAITSFSVVPMKALFLAGAGLAVTSMLCALILAAIGIVGLYLGKVFLQTKNRPIYVIRREI